MSRYKSYAQNASHEGFLAELQGKIRESKSLLTPDLAKAVAGMQAMPDDNMIGLTTTLDGISTELDACGLQSLLEGHYGADNTTAIALGREAATLLMASAGDMKGFTAASEVEVGENTYMSPNSVAGTQAFEEKDASNYIAQSILLAAFSAHNGPDDELFFPTTVVEGGTNGVSVDIQIPYVFNRTNRKTDGTKFEYEKVPLHRALEDHTILESDICRIWPNADIAKAGLLVSASDVPTLNKNVNGVDVKTRPIKFGAEVDLMGISAHPGLIGPDAQGIEDTVSANINLGEVFYRFSVVVPDTTVGAAAGATVTKTQVVSFKVDNTQGALFMKSNNAGMANDLVMNYSNSIVLTSKGVDVSGVAIDMGIGGLLSDGGKGWAVTIGVELNGKANHDTAYYRVFANHSEVSGARIVGSTDGLASDNPGLLDLIANMTITPLGGYPLAQRTNSGLQQMGYLLDAGEKETFFFELREGSPIASIGPTDGSETTMGDITMMHQATRTLSSNNAITTILNHLEDVKLAHGTGNPMSGTGSIGERYTKPTYMEDTIDAISDVQVLESLHTLENLKAVIIDAVSVMASEMAYSSGYNTSMRHLSKDDSEYGIAIWTEERLERLLMRSGDPRTFGDGRKFTVASSVDSRMASKILFSFYRKNRKVVADPFSIGFRLAQPPVIRKLDNSQKTRTLVNEVHMRPREHHVAILPIMGVLQINNLTAYYKRATA